MICDVDNLMDVREGLLNELLDAALECCLGTRTALTASEEFHEKNIIIHVDDFDVPAVLGQCRPDLLIE